jgi:hypothetical protein
MPSRNEACPCGSKQKYKRCCLGASRCSGPPGAPPPRRPPPSGVDAATAEAAVLVEELMASPHPLRRISDGMVLLRTMFEEGGPLACLRWSWDELVPPVERHIFRVTEEVTDMEERRARLFDRCAPDLLGPEPGDLPAEPGGARGTRGRAAGAAAPGPAARGGGPGGARLQGVSPRPSGPPVR